MPTLISLYLLGVCLVVALCAWTRFCNRKKVLIFFYGAEEPALVSAGCPFWRTLDSGLQACYKLFR